MLSDMNIFLAPRIPMIAPMPPLIDEPMKFTFSFVENPSPTPIAPSMTPRTVKILSNVSTVDVTE